VLVALVLVEVLDEVDVVAGVARWLLMETLKAPKPSMVSAIIARLSRTARRSESALERRGAGGGVWRGIGWS
jgi:hypothetical protein